MVNNRIKLMFGMVIQLVSIETRNQLKTERIIIYPISVADRVIV